MGGRQSNLQEAIVRTPIDGARRTSRDIPAGGDALLYLRAPGGGDGPALVGPAGPLSVATAAAGGAQDLGAPLLIHLSLGTVFREEMLISLMDMDVGDNIILG